MTLYILAPDNQSITTALAHCKLNKRFDMEYSQTDATQQKTRDTKIVCVRGDLYRGHTYLFSGDDIVCIHDHILVYVLLLMITSYSVVDDVQIQCSQ